VTEKTVAASMARQGLVARPKRRFRCLTRPDKRAVPFPDLVRRDFSSPASNVKRCGDMTEIPTAEGKLYLADVEDLFSRRIVGFAISEHPDAELARAALQTAVAIRGGAVTDVIFHSD
jgi:transposase InsO family protein